MKHYHVFSKKPFIDEYGKHQATWYKCGHIKKNPNGAKFLTLYTQPETQYFVFDNLEDPDDETGEK